MCDRHLLSITTSLRLHATASSSRVFGVKGKLSTTGIRNPIWEPGFSKSSRAVKLYFVSTDQVKILVMERLAALPFLTRAGTPCLTDEGCGRNPSAYRFSNTLSDAFFTQCGNERRYIKFVHNVPRHEFHPVQQGARRKRSTVSFMRRPSGIHWRTST